MADTVITDTDPVDLTLQIDADGKLKWSITRNTDSEELAASGQDYFLEMQLIHTA